MSAEAVGWVYRYSPAKGAALLVHLAIADSANDQHRYEVWMRQHVIATKARLSVRAVGDALAWLTENGLLDLIEEGKAAGKSNRYRLLMPEGLAVMYDPQRGYAQSADPPEGGTHEVQTGMARREVTEVAATDELGRTSAWQITNYKIDRNTGGKWEAMGPPLLWEYEFPPVLHWKNLPNANNAYGRSEVAGLVEMQDRINFVSSNISKIIRYHAHPKTWGRGAGLGNKASWGADEIVMVNGQDAMIQNLEMQSDLVSSREFRDELKTALMEISRTVDLASMKDKIGALTNFGLRVMYNDALDKCSTKRDTFGEALRELVHRLLALDNRPGEAGEVVWPDPLPVNEVEEIQAYGFDLENGLVSKQTVSERRGYDWEAEQERIEEEKESEDNIGSALLRAFVRGQPAQFRPAQQPQPQMQEEPEELHVLFWEIVLIGIPVIVFVAAIYFFWWKKLPTDERNEYRHRHLFGKKSRRRDGGGAITFLINIGFFIKVYVDGNWNVPFATWTVDYLVYSYLWVIVWMAVIFGDSSCHRCCLVDTSGAEKIA